MEKRRWMLGLIVVVMGLLVLIFSFTRTEFNNKGAINGTIIIVNDNFADVEYCTSDSDCIPSSCCHPKSCVVKSSAPTCSRIFCTQECAPGSLDCGQGSCGCVNNKCLAVLN